MNLNKVNPEDYNNYWIGKKNKAIRYYFYAQSGLTLLNEFRYIIMSVFAIYYALRINNIWLIPIMFFSSIPFLMILGYINQHHMKKTIDFLSTKFSTHYGIYTVDLQEERTKLLREILNEIKAQNITRNAEILNNVPWRTSNGSTS